MTNAIISKKDLSILSEINHFSIDAKRVTHVVGGSIRDILLSAGSPLSDIDLVSDFPCADFVKELAKKVGAKALLFDKFQTAKLLFNDPKIKIGLDFASRRKETYSSSGALPEVSVGTVREDCFRRDFTINSLFVPLDDFVTWLSEGSSSADSLKDKVIDYTNGLNDLEKKSIEVLHSKSFEDDPTRIFRAFRYAVKIGGTISSSTQSLLEKAVDENVFSNISLNRCFSELRRSLEESRSDEIIKLIGDNRISDLLNWFPSDKTELLCRAYKRCDFLEEDLTVKDRLQVLYRIWGFFQSTDLFSDFVDSLLCKKKTKLEIVSDVQILRQTLSKKEDMTHYGLKSLNLLFN